MYSLRLAFMFVLLACFTAPVSAQGTRLLRHPTVSRESIAFQYGGDLWVVSRSGGQARRVTSTQGVELDPFFSPDGSRSRTPRRSLVTPTSTSYQPQAAIRSV